MATLPFGSFQPILEPNIMLTHLNKLQEIILHNFHRNGFDQFW